MSKALSVDLRVRVLAAVAGGATHRDAAERFGVKCGEREPLAGVGADTRRCPAEGSRRGPQVGANRGKQGCRPCGAGAEGRSLDRGDPAPPA